jgi:glycosyltransferase involved in cell wall biosynthesis
MAAVAVIIATYNTAAHVGEAVRSVLAQTLSDLELVIVDDGSTDDTASVLAEFLADGRVRCVRQENRGQAAAKNRGLRESRAPIVGFCDADDYWHPRKLEWQLPAFEAPEVGVVYSRERRFRDGPNGREPVLYLPERCHVGRVTEPLFVENFVPFGTALVRRELLERWGAFDEQYRMSIDWELWLRLSLHCEFYFVDEVTYFYRIWDQQMSSDWRGRYRDVVRIMDAFLASQPHAVSPATVRRAWAHTFTHRARARAMKDGQHLLGLRDSVLAVMRDPAYREGWRNFGWIAREAWRSWARRGSAQASGIQPGR